jgi:hypothetical protein
VTPSSSEPLPPRAEPQRHPSHCRAAEGDVIDEAKLAGPGRRHWWTMCSASDRRACHRHRICFADLPALRRLPQRAVYPQLQGATISTPARSSFILRPFVRNVLDAAVFMLAEAAGPTNYHNVVDDLFQDPAGPGPLRPTPRDAIFEIAKQLGFTQETFDAALTNQDLFTGMEALRDQALNEFGLEGTPTFYINGKTLSGAKRLNSLRPKSIPLVS